VCFLLYLYTLFGNIEFYFEKTKFIMAASMIAAVSNVALNFLFIPLCGYIAAGYTTLACYILFAGMHYVFMRQVCKEHLDGAKIYDMRFIIGISIGLLLASGVFMAFYRMPVIRYVLAAAIAGCCLLKRRYILSMFTGLK
jgi:O-antigen/teichoic acid export membrane protein